MLAFYFLLCYLDNVQLARLEDFMIKFELKQQNNKQFLVAKDYNTSNGKTKLLAFAKSVKLTPNGAKLVKKLLQIQKIAINNDYTKLLKVINQKLFAINEAYRKRIINNAKKVILDFEGCTTFNYITCYNLLND